MKIIDLTFDERIQGFCATVTCSYEWYLAATKDAEQNLAIQRGIIKGTKAYRTLRADLKRGCILPPLVLAGSRLALPAGLDPGDIKDDDLLLQRINELQPTLEGLAPKDTYIVDGLQRTNALRQTLEEIEDPGEQATFKGRPLRVEIWLNIPFGAVAYRMLLLNAGQRPMSVKHQVEVLSMKLGDDLGAIPNIEMLTSLGGQRRTKAGQFSLAKLSQAFQAWLQGSPNIDVRNAMMEQLLAESAIETLGTSLSGTGAHDDFKQLVEWFVKMDTHIFADDSQFFGNETVLLGISGAVGSAQRNETLRDRVTKCLGQLEALGASGTDDPLAAVRFNELRQGIDVKKVNVGQFTRKMVYGAFQEFFLTDGTKSMEECWAFGAAQF